MKLPMRFAAVAVCGIAIVVWAQTQTPGKGKATELESPAGAGSGEPNLTVSSDGRVSLSWIEPRLPKGHVLKIAHLQKPGRWSTPVTIAEGDDWFVNWADFPSILALPGGQLAAHWLAKSGPDTYAYDVKISISKDGGKSWVKPITPHRDGTKTEHGFVSLLPGRDGGLAAIWLDGRKMASARGHESHGAASEMSLMFTTIAPDGQLGPEVQIDGRVCECCQTSAAVTRDGYLVAYRDRSEREIRDIAISRFSAGRWSEPRNVSNDNWEIPGCPVNGPALAVNGDAAAVAWFTGAGDKPQVYARLSTDGGRTFGARARIDDGNPLGRVDVVPGDKGSWIVGWLERTPGGGDIRIRHIGPAGAPAPSITLAHTTTARASGFPRLERSGNDLILAWTDAEGKGRVRTAVLRIDAAANVSQSAPPER